MRTDDGESQNDGWDTSGEHAHAQTRNDVGRRTGKRLA